MLVRWGVLWKRWSVLPNVFWRNLAKKYDYFSERRESQKQGRHLSSGMQSWIIHLSCSRHWSTDEYVIFSYDIPEKSNYNILATYKLNCTCSDTECSWISEPSFTCQTGCPFLHPGTALNSRYLRFEWLMRDYFEHLSGKISKLKHWEDDRDSKLNQIKFKVKFRSPSQIPEEWRLLVTFG